MKKKIPLQVLETIEPFVNKRGTSFDSIEPNDFLLRFVDKDEKSDFYFNVEGHRMENGFQLLIDWKPMNKQSIMNRRMWVKAEQLETYLSNWIILLEGYEKVKTFFDDPILDAFAEEYFTEFEIIDEDAELKPFTTKQVFILDDHLDYIQNKIDKFQTEENKIEIQEIKNDVVELRNNLTKKPKKWVIKQLSKIWAKITKQGPKLMKEFLNETKKLAIKEGVKLVFEKGIDLII